MLKRKSRRNITILSHEAISLLVLSIFHHVQPFLYVFDHPFRKEVLATAGFSDIYGSIFFFVFWLGSTQRLVQMRAQPCHLPLSRTSSLIQSSHLPLSNHNPSRSLLLILIFLSSNISYFDIRLVVK